MADYYGFLGLIAMNWLRDIRIGKPKWVMFCILLGETAIELIKRGCTSKFIEKLEKVQG